MSNIINALAARKNVHPSFLEYIGTMDETKTIGAKLHMFNIEDPHHPNFRSSIAYRENV